MGKKINYIRTSYLNFIEIRLTGDYHPEFDSFYTKKSQKAPCFSIGDEWLS